MKNERQYRITRAQAERFSQALREFEGQRSEPAGVHPLLLKAREDAIRSQLGDLEGALREYEALRAGHFEFDQLKTIAELPKMLIRARIARGLSQRDLADRLGLKEQQIQRYEASEYELASFARIRNVVDALGLDIEPSKQGPTTTSSNPSRPRNWWQDSDGPAPAGCSGNCRAC